MNDSHTLQISKVSHNGSGIARLPEGVVVFVPNALPGELIRVRNISLHKGFATAVLDEILEPSPQRIAPHCPHFNECGGCHLQHVAYPYQITLKEQILADHFSRTMKNTAFAPQPLIAAANPWRYRNILQMHLDKENHLGFQKGESHEVIPIRECHLPIEPLEGIWNCLDLNLEIPFDRLSFRCGTYNDVLITFESSVDVPTEFEVDFPISAVHITPEKTMTLSGDSYNIFCVKGKDFRVSAGSFFQVNTSMAEVLVDTVLDLVQPAPSMEVLELYSGVGLFSAFLAPEVQQLDCVEINPSACEDFIENLDAYDNVTLYNGAVEEVLPQLEGKGRTILLDPPRSGVPRYALSALMKLEPQKIIYTSCDPATLARDARILQEAGFLLQKAIPLDMFPQTYHCEVIALFSLL